MSRKNNRISLLDTKDLETRFLAKCFLKNSAIAKIIDIVSSDMFQSNHNGNIYYALTELFKDSKYIDDLTVVSKIQSLGYSVTEELSQYISSLLNGGIETSSAGIEDYANELAKRFKIRKTSEQIDILNANKLEYIEKDCLIDKVLEVGVKVSNLSINSKKDIKKISVDTKEYIDDLRDKLNSTGFKLNGIPMLFWNKEDPSKYSKLDLALDGAREGQIISIAADSGVGKSYFSCHVIISMCRYVKEILNNSKSIIYFSLEMSKKEIVDRLISIIICQKEQNKPFNLKKYFNSDFIDHPKLYFIENSIPQNDKNVQEFENMIQEALDEINSWNLIIDDTESMSANDLTAKVNKIKIQSKQDIGCVILDYAGLLDNNMGDENKNVSETYRVLTPFAKKIKTPFIILNQLLKSFLKIENDYRPSNQAAPGEGKPKKDSHVMLFIYRWDIYDDVMTKEQNFNKANLMDIIVAKLRGRRNPNKITFWWNEGMGMKEYSVDNNIEKDLYKAMADIGDDL